MPSGSRVEVTAALLAVIQREQHLRDRDTFFLEQFLVGMRQPDLAHGRGSLLFFESQRSLGEFELAPAERDRAR